MIVANTIFSYQHILPDSHIFEPAVVCFF